ncbi:hypothetical protein VKT23_008445 [Stygiomarasmius scandens]|uniref:Cytochrome P450 n=1 Tax=Marasmiellus scandens TaxID=2682957 RepID=A0ABR1JHJ0_9AGAR
MPSTFELYGLLVTVAILLTGIAIKYYRRLPLPPTLPSEGLKGGSLLTPWKRYAAWSKVSGSPLVTIPAYGRPIIVVNTLPSAIELLEKRSVFADRPRWPMAELLGRQDNVGFTYYGDRLRRMRKTLHSALNANAVFGTWGKLLDAHAMGMCRAFLDKPEEFYDAVENNVQELIVCFAYGRRATPEFIQNAKQVMHQTGEALQPGRWTVNFIPALIHVPAWFPGAGFKTWARNAREAFMAMTRKPFYEIKEELEHGRAAHSFVQESLENLPNSHSEEDEDVIKCVAGSLFSAGTETVIGTVLSLIAILAEHSEIQQRAYEEINRVIGTDRLPSLTDRSELPYINAVVQEIHRWNPAVPLVTHGNSREDYYKGMRIPEKTWIMANVWAMLHDEQMYPNPEKFIPERFLFGDDHKEPQLDPNNIVFGFGRRRCPGTHFANAYLFLVLSRMISCFEILPGDDLKRPIDFGLGLVSYVFSPGG